MHDIHTWLESVRKNAAAPTILVISPHLDDAGLSAGATIANFTRNGCKVTVFTVFAGIPNPPYSPVASHIHQTWGLEDDPVASRLAEDIEAMHILLAEPQHGDFLDFIYRVHLESISDLRDYSVNEYDTDRVEEVSRTLMRLIHTEQPDLVLTCSAIGAHTDHRHVRDATISACINTAVPLLVWEDIPYVFYSSEIPHLPTNVTLGTRLAVANHEEYAWQAKYDAIECYGSQQAELWQGRDFRALLNEYAGSQSGESGNNVRVEVFWSLKGLPNAAQEFVIGDSPWLHSKTM